jgi:hypothetical protein
MIMGTWMKRGLLAALFLFVGLFIYLLNRPLALAVDDRFSASDVGILMPDEQGDQDTGVIGYEKHVENDFLSLYVDEDTGYFAIKDKRNDHTWYSVNTRNDPLIQSNSIRNLQRSTFQISYLRQDETIATMTNYEYSIQYKRDFDDSFTLTLTDQGFEVSYTLRDREPKGYWFPAYITAERFIELVQTPVQLNGSPMDLRNLLDYYGPSADDPSVYEIRQLIKDEETNQYDMSQLSGAQVETLFKLFYDIGYYGNKTDEGGAYLEEYHLDDVQADNAAFGILENYVIPEFVIPMEVTLQDDSLDVKINYFDIVERNGFEIVGIRLLPYFGATRNDTDGYLVLPEGSGGLIHFNNGKTASKSYSSYLYGMDNTIIPEELPLTDEGARLPYFGIKAPDNAMLGIIESGEAHSLITADVSGKHDSYNKIYNEFLFRQAGRYRLAENNVQLWSDEDYVYSPAITYYFQQGDDADYTGMARLFGAYLASRYRWNELVDREYALQLDILGSYDYDSFFLWFPTNKNESLTTYEQAQAIVQELQDAGVSHQVIRYLGWFNNGIEHAVPSDINLDRSVGNRRALQAFNDFLAEQGYPVYYDVDFVHVYDSGMFYTTRNYSRVIGGNVSRFYPYSVGTRLPDRTKDPYYLSNLSAIDRNTDGFLRDAERLDLPGISFRSLGDTIYSDYANGRLFPRQYAATYLEDILAKFQAFDTMVTGGNLYSLAMAPYVTDLTSRTSSLVVVDEAIPFVQLAIAPYLEYALPAFNFGDKYELDTYLLHALATGSNPKALISHDNTAELMHTDFNAYFSVHYASHKDDIVELMEAFDALGLDGSHLVRHRIVANGLVEVTYSTGRTFRINFTDETLDVEDIVVPASSYLEIEVE